MDFGGDFFWVMLIVYLIYQVLGARKKKRQHQQRRPAEQQPRPLSTGAGDENELDEALREIRQALGFPDSQREPSSRPVPSPRPEPTPLAEPAPQPTAKPVERPLSRTERTPLQDRPKSVPPRPAVKSGGSFDSAGENAAFRRENAFEKFNKVPADFPQPKDVGSWRESPLAPLPAPTRDVSPLLAPPDVEDGSRLPHIVKRLRNPSTAREAFLMKEILDPPRAMRSRR